MEWRSLSRSNVESRNISDDGKEERGRKEENYWIVFVSSIIAPFVRCSDVFVYALRECFQTEQKKVQKTTPTAIAVFTLEILL